MSNYLTNLKYDYEVLENRYNQLLNSIIEVKNQMLEYGLDNNDEILVNFSSILSNIEKKYCRHDLKPDYSYFDPCKTIYSCSKCKYHTI